MLVFEFLGKLFLKELTKDEAYKNKGLFVLIKGYSVELAF